MHAGGPNEQAYALLKCFTQNLFAFQQCFDQGVQLYQLSGHELNGVVEEVDLPATPNEAVLELRLFPQNWRSNCAEEQRH